MQIKAMKPVIFLLAILTLASLACSVDLFGTPTPAPALEVPSTEASAQPEQPAATTEPQQPTTNAQQFYTEEFDSESESWQYLVVNGSNKKIVNGIVGLMSVRPIGGLLIFDLQGPSAWVYATYEPYTYTDVRLDIRTNNRGSNNNNISLICRKSDAGWFEFDIANNGLYEILFGKIVGDSVEYTPIADGGSSRIKTGMAENEYGITCLGNTLTLYINGEEARRLEDKKYLLPEGKVGLAVSSFRDAPVTVDFFWAKISQP
ncbi:hypothetical protein [Candidatus Villigracilis saccharophilus]|uniref:hypothetical protein n=1 Tax=Candidatus Villigracilis saccharophilus TaxID=3140684 RepID=UPI0031376867|nr:hypothetical protein [Anaerolineales bacterium]